MAVHYPDNGPIYGDPADIGTGHIGQPNPELETDEYFDAAVLVDKHAIRHKRCGYITACRIAGDRSANIHRSWQCRKCGAHHNVFDYINAMKTHITGNMARGLASLPQELLSKILGYLPKSIITCSKTTWTRNFLISSVKVNLNAYADTDIGWRPYKVWGSATVNAAVLAMSTNPTLLDAIVSATRATLNGAVGDKFRITPSEMATAFRVAINETQSSPRSAKHRPRDILMKEARRNTFSLARTFLPVGAPQPESDDSDDDRSASSANDTATIVISDTDDDDDNDNDTDSQPPHKKAHTWRPFKKHWSTCRGGSQCRCHLH